MLVHRMPAAGWLLKHCDAAARHVARRTPRNIPPRGARASTSAAPAAAWWHAEGGETGARDDAASAQQLLDTTWSLDDLAERGYDIGPQALSAAVLCSRVTAHTALNTGRRWSAVYRTVLQAESARYLSGYSDLPRLAYITALVARDSAAHGVAAGLEGALAYTRLLSAGSQTDVAAVFADLRAAGVQPAAAHYAAASAWAASPGEFAATLAAGRGLARRERVRRANFGARACDAPLMAHRATADVQPEPERVLALRFLIRWAAHKAALVEQKVHHQRGAARGANGGSAEKTGKGSQTAATGDATTTDERSEGEHGAALHDPVGAALVSADCLPGGRVFATHAAGAAAMAAPPPPQPPFQHVGMAHGFPAEADSEAADALTPAAFHEVLAAAAGRGVLRDVGIDHNAVGTRVTDTEWALAVELCTAARRFDILQDVLQAGDGAWLKHRPAVCHAVVLACAARATELRDVWCRLGHAVAAHHPARLRPALLAVYVAAGDVDLAKALKREAMAQKEATPALLLMFRNALTGAGDNAAAEVVEEEAARLLATC